MFIQTDEIESRTDDLVRIIYQGIHDRSLLCMDATHFVGHFLIIGIFIARTSSLIFQMARRAVESTADDLIIFNNDTAAAITLARGL